MYKTQNGRVSPKFQRTSSLICDPPEQELLTAVLNNDSPKIRRLIQANRGLLSHHYSPEYNKRILQIACSENVVKGKTVETLLSLGANPRDADDGYEALHFAAQKTDFETLNVLLKRNPQDINITCNGSNALHLLIRYGNEDSKDFLKCVELLIKKGINVNCGDTKNVSPILWAAKKGQKEVIQTILDNSVVPVDLDSHQLRGNTARQLIESQNLYNGVLPKTITDVELDEGKILVTLLKMRNEDAFNNFKKDITELANYDDGNSTLLQMCCEKGLSDSAKYLLDNGADPNRTSPGNNQTPVEIAALNGFSDIFKHLLDKTETKLSSNLLIILLKYVDAREFHGYYECYKELIKKLKQQYKDNPDEMSFILNQRDSSKNTPLHYAIRYGSPEIVEELLNLGASLGAKNRYGFLPVQDIEPHILEKHLDNCVDFNMKTKQVDKEDFQVTFKYRSLIPPYAKSNVTEAYHDDLEAAKFKSTLQRELVAETEVIYFMSKSPEFKYLLKHPVIVSFLFMKWLRIQWLFWTNLAFYITFALSLLIYIFTDYAFFSTEEKSSFHSVVSKLSYGILLLTLLILMARELFQICVAPKNYFKNFENYIEIILIIITGMIVFIFNPEHDTRKQLSSLAILLAAFELVLMLGQHPYFSTNVVMLRTVSFNFFKFLIWYSLLIIAFALSFYLLFATQAVEPNGNKNETSITLIGQKNETAKEDNRDDNEEPFENAGNSVFKTIIMLTGEFDASDLNFKTFPITSKIIFALFIFMIAIILLNLLNGLAVSDTQMIRNDAELVGHIARAQHIQYVESMLVGNVLPTNVIKRLSDMCCCFPIPRNWQCGLGQSLAKDACLFPKYLNYELTFKPNKGGLIADNNKDKKELRKSCTPCAAIYLDKETIKRTKTIAKERIDEQMRNDENDIKQIKDELANLRVKMDNLLRHVNVSDYNE